MLGEIGAKKAISITFQATEISAKLLVNLFRDFIRKKNNMPKEKFGKQTIKQLNRKNQTLADIPLSASDLKGMQRILRSFGVDYAIKKDTVTPDTYTAYFKARDTSQIEKALESYAARKFNNQERGKPSLKERLAAAKEKSANINQENILNQERHKAQDIGAR